ncbi:MAG TPA: S8 family serine peptidase [Longilinea sp.]|nr:S8 family serine peptidase [Longilinea sp.]
MQDEKFPVNNEIEPQQNQVNKRQGCAVFLLFFVAIFWLVGMTVLTQSVSWVLEQTIFEGYPTQDIRWMFPLLYGAALLIPFGIMARKITSPRSHLAYRTWGLAAAFAVLQTPSRLLAITDAQTVAVVQTGVMVLYLILLNQWLKRISPDWKPWNEVTWRGLEPALLIGFLVSLPWLMWGAFGSPVDTLVNLVVGLLFGVCASWTIFGGLLSATQRKDQDYRTADILIDGLIIGMALMIMVTGFGQTGMQWVLLLCLPVLGWTAAMLAQAGRDEDQRPNWVGMAWLLGLASAWPLMLTDPDELSLIISSGVGERIEWVSRAGLVTLLMGVTATFALLAGWRWLKRRAQFPLAGKFITAGVIFLAVGVYFLFGRPGFYGERLFVILKNQADLTQISANLPWQEKRAQVYQTLVKQAEGDQKGLRTVLDRYGIKYTPYYLVNALEVQSGPLVRSWLRTRPEVDRILDSPILRPLPQPLTANQGTLSAPSSPTWNVMLIEADKVWNLLGITGEGIRVGIADSGIQGNHPAISAAYAGVGSGSGPAWLDPWNQTSSPSDLSGHGTGVTSIILGKNTGVAPGAQWIGCVNLARNLGNPAYYVECMQFLLAPYPQGSDPFVAGETDAGAQVVNYSWSCPSVEGCDADALQPVVAAIRAAGIFQAAAAGNLGTDYCGTVSDPPAIYAQVFSVGSIDSDENMSTFSSVGPVLVDGSLRAKPDILAPGEDVIAANANSSYESVGGTSFASPHVAGVVALMWSANPKLIGNVNLTEQLLRQSAKPYSGPKPECPVNESTGASGSNYGILNAFEAVRLATAASVNP